MQGQFFLFAGRQTLFAFQRCAVPTLSTAATCRVSRTSRLDAGARVHGSVADFGDDVQCATGARAREQRSGDINGRRSTKEKRL